MKITNGPTRKPGKHASGEIQIINRGNLTAEVLIYGDIGDSWFDDGITAKQFAEDLQSLGDISSLNVRINSTGGSVFDGVAIYNTLLSHKAEIIVDIEGAALSIASIIAMAGDVVRMAENGFFMIHEPHGMFAGNSKELRKAADTLDIVRGQLISTYVNQRNIDRDRVDKWLTDETWFDAAGALDAGFIDQITGKVEIAARYDVSQFKNPPEILKNPENVVNIGTTTAKSSASAALSRMKQGLKAQKIK